MQATINRTNAAAQREPDLLDRGVRSNGNWMWRRLRSYLETGDPASTMDRLFDSKHVRDLQLLVAIALGSVFLVFVLGLLISVVDEVANNWRAFGGSDPWWMASLRMGKHLFLGIASFLTFFGPVLGLLVGVLAWTYQVGSARLGVVDLFACEIGTLCRVVTVFDTVQRYVDGFNEAPTARPGNDERKPKPHFSSQENYFPVFDNNTEELQALEARVVINITAFYTYMKAFRDSLRARDDIVDKAAGNDA